MWIYLRPVAIISICLAFGCSSGSNAIDKANTNSTDSHIVQSSLARITAPLVSASDFESVVAGNTAFALKLFPLLDTIPDNNTFFSPYSITMAFALLAPGAGTTTQSEIDNIVFNNIPLSSCAPALNKLDLLLAAEASGTTLDNGLQTPKLTNANAVWGQNGFSILPTYLDNIAVNYGAVLHLVDFITATDLSRQYINNWVAGETNNRIQDLLPQGSVTVDTRIVLTNAIWFKANWAKQFSSSNTSSRTFNNLNNSATTVSFMQQTLSLPYAQTAGCQAVDIPYSGDNLSMLVIMPASGTFDTFIRSLTPTVISDITSNLSTKTVSFSMPKFTFTKASSVDTILKTLGMTDTFNPNRADLSGIDGRRDLFVSAVFHKAFIAVDEAGTEAAAATGITIGTTSIPVQTITLSIDHPFIFLIRDRQTGLILFMGKVVSL